MLQWKRKLLVSFLEPNEVELFPCQMVLDQNPERKTNTHSNRLEKGTESECAPECQTFGTVVCGGDGSFTFDSIMNESLE